MHVENKTDEWTTKIQVQVANREAREGFAIIGDFLMFKWRYCIGPNLAPRADILKELHESQTGGHARYYRTLHRVRLQFYWPGMTRQIKKFVSESLICQQIKILQEKPLGLLHPLEIPTAIWEEVSIDFVTWLPPVGSHSVIVVVVDRLSKYCHLGSLPELYTAVSVAQFFADHIVRHYGIPKKLVSNQDKVFLSKFWQELFWRSGTTINMSSAYHPESDGQRS